MRDPSSTLTIISGIFVSIAIPGSLRPPPAAANSAISRRSVATTCPTTIFATRRGTQSSRRCMSRPAGTPTTVWARRGGWKSIAKSGGVAQRYVAHVPLASPQAAALIEAQASFGRVVGIRDILSWSEDPMRRFAQRGDLMRDPIWRADLGLLARHDLVFDLMVYANQLGEAARLARDFPDQPFVLEHGGSPIDRDAKALRRWREGLAASAQSPNVAIKISDLVGYDHDWTLDSLRAVVCTASTASDPRGRCSAATSRSRACMRRLMTCTARSRRLSQGFLESEQRALFLDNAKRIYRVDTPSTAENWG